MINEPAPPDPRPPVKHPPLMDLSFATLGWLHRSASAIGADRFFETLERAQFYLGRTRSHAVTPGEHAVVAGLDEALAGLIDADRAARRLLKDSVSGLDAAEATEFVEMCETAEDEGIMP